MKKLGIAKIGGSLISWPGLPSSLKSFLSSRPDYQWLLIPGGGHAANVIRELDRTHQLGEEKSHWLALAAMTLNAHFIASLLNVIPVVNQPDLDDRDVQILNPIAFCRNDDQNQLRIPHSWEATSDAVAARAAEVFRPDSFVVFKSAAALDSMQEMVRTGYVDSEFPKIVARASLQVEFINLLTWHAT